MFDSLKGRFSRRFFRFSCFSDIMIRHRVYFCRMKNGELLAELDNLTLTPSVRQAKASSTSVKSQLNYATLTYDRTKQLFEANAATLADF